MLKNDAQSRLYCSHYQPSNIDCPDCRLTEKDYKNRPLYAPLYVPVPNLPNVVNHSQLKLPNAFYVPFDDKRKSLSLKTLSSNDYIEMKTNRGVIRLPRSILIERSRVNETIKNNNQGGANDAPCDSQQIFPGDFQKHAHRFTRSFSWKTKPEEPPYAQMQPLPKLVKRPGYVEICCKNICWPTHQLCLCCTRNVAESCRKWSKSTGEYDYIDACWSSCALCSDDAYKILNTPVVYNEKIIDPEVLLPLDAELLYYSIQSAKRQEEKQRNLSLKSIVPQQQPQISENQQESAIPFVDNKDVSKTLLSVLENQDSKIQSEAQLQQQSMTPTSTIIKIIDELKPVRKVKSSKSSRSVRKKPSNKSRRSRHNSKRRVNQSKSRSKRKSRSKK